MGLLTPSATISSHGQSQARLNCSPGERLLRTRGHENVPSQEAVRLHDRERFPIPICSIRANLIYHPQRQNVAPSAPAQTAAAQAFLASRPSTANLSASAAAATALRSMSPNPTPVSGVQTKRMLQRQNSTSSCGEDGRQLQRRSSSGSMTNRTFRTPSPNRPSQSLTLEELPPIPPVPKAYNNDSHHRRAASMEPSMRVMSPPPSKKGGRVTSLDRAPVSSQKVQQMQQEQRQTSLKDENELERSASRGSINFSYPTGARPISPPAPRPLSPILPPSINGISREAANDVRVANQPVKRKMKKKKRFASGSGEGSNAMGGRPLATTVTASSSDAREPRQTPTSPTQTTEIICELSPQTYGHRESPAYGSDHDSSPEEICKEKRPQRASGLLHKQPSVVREDWEGEQGYPPQPENKTKRRAAAASTTSSSPSGIRSRKEAASGDPSRAVERLDRSVQKARPTPHLVTTFPSTTVTPKAESPFQGHLEVAENPVRSARQSSISPSRSARFSAHLASDLSSRPLHEPPPRSVSPAKSALKPSSQSASPIDGAATTGGRGASLASSEASDNASMTSAEGFGTKPPRKKSAHVSFEAEPELVGTAAEVAPSDTPIFVSPQHKGSGKRGWFGKSKARHLDSIPAEDEMEEVMKPRPALPSFGSVRGQRDGSAVRVMPVAEVASPNSSDTSSTTSNLATLDTSISSDHAIGVLLARESLKHHQEAVANTPKATHAAVTLMGTDDIDQGRDLRANGTLDSLTGDCGNPSLHPGIPSIAIQPATPGTAEPRSQDEWLVEVPGGFPAPFELEGDSPPNQGGGAISPGDREVSTSAPNYIGISESKPSELAAAEDPSGPAVGSIYGSLRQQTEHTSDSESGGGSIYSDAAEDLSDLEGDGFGSINAIVESPVIGAPMNRTDTPPDSPLAGKPNHERKDVHNRQSSREGAEAHWGRVSEGRRRTTDHDPPRDQELVQAKPRKRQKKTRKVGDAIASAQPAKGSSSLISGPRGGALPQPAALPATRGDKVSSRQGGLRRSMRDHPEGTSDAPGFRSSMRTMKSAEAQTGIPPPPSLPKGALQKRKIPVTTAAVASNARPESKPTSGFSHNSVVAPRRRRSNDSGSSSSFRRSRRPASSGVKLTMRTTMRAGEDRPTSPPAAAGRGIRSLSPQDRRPYSPMGQGTLRSTMRGSADAGVPSLRNQDRRRHYPTVSGPKKPWSKEKAASPKPLASKLKSRLSNSDENVSESHAFRSRFEDSSDDEPGELRFRPVRGIPGKLDQGDSTDLEDSSDEGGMRTTRRQGPKSPHAVDGINGKVSRTSQVPSQTASPEPMDGKKKGIFDRFRSKKAKDSTRDDAQPAITEREERRRESRAEPQGARSPEVPASPEGRGKLQRRHNPQQVRDDSWPLPPKAICDDDAPMTSEGADGAEGVNGRPGLGSRQDTSGTTRTEGGTPVLGRTGKKKRFTRLRKAFRLHD